MKGYCRFEDINTPPTELVYLTEKEMVEEAVRILCKAGVLLDAKTLDAIDEWREE